MIDDLVSQILDFIECNEDLEPANLTTGEGEQEE